MVARAANLGSAIVNGTLVVAAAGLAIGSRTGSSGSGDAEEGFAAWLIRQPFGSLLVGLVGGALIGAGAVQVWRALTGKYQERVKLPAGQKNLLHLVCATGLAARGVLLAITGGFFVYAAVTLNPDQAGGISDALDWLRALPFGAYLYGFAAAGLIAFGLYSAIEARYRSLDAPDKGDLRRAAAKLPGVSR
jgi:hypothetical protein